MKELKGLREGHTTNDSITKLALNFIEIIQKTKTQCDFIEYAIKVSHDIQLLFSQFDKLKTNLDAINTVTLGLSDKQKQVTFSVH